MLVLDQTQSNGSGADVLTGNCALSPLLLPLRSLLAAAAGSRSCRSYCGNITVDYPFGVRDGCGHQHSGSSCSASTAFCFSTSPPAPTAFLPSTTLSGGSLLHDASMSDCYSLAPSSPGHGFVAEPWRAPFLGPASDNVFFLLGCRHDSPVFQLGFPVGRGVCRSVSGMSCRDYYRCPAWDVGDSRKPWPRARGADSAYGAAPSPPECCSVPAGAVRELNLTQLRCAAYSSAYSLAPLRPPGAGAWSYGIRIAYSLPAEHEAECRGCQFSGGTCGYDASNLTADDDGDNGGDLAHLCLCGGGGGEGGIDAWNSTSTCDSTGNGVNFYKVSS
ncbi:hypothetical protein KSP40_PGU020816 [Platanthera guangdongensis]|uniref:Wall-associated receptor kinase galacturonan-binding domain-containing protein n=1 Tax=Platanthera guangdongensis TaxID=2320717 RepID=A0ABR2MBJ6_9ASPA